MISSNQVEIIEQINQIDKRIGTIDKKIEEKSKLGATYAKEMNKIDQIEEISAKMSNSLRTCAIKLNQINLKLPPDSRLEKFTFD